MRDFLGTIVVYLPKLGTLGFMRDKDCTTFGR